MDSNIATHDKILDVLAQRNGVNAAWMYVCSLGYSGGHGTDGAIPFNALPFIHGNKSLPGLLVDARLWTPEPAGWSIPNWAERQEMSMITEQKRAAQSKGGTKGNCIKHHGPDCGCWAQ